jgi:hypothetical protein
MNGGEGCGSPHLSGVYMANFKFTGDPNAEDIREGVKFSDMSLAARHTRMLQSARLLPSCAVTDISLRKKQHGQASPRLINNGARHGID